MIKKVFLFLFVTYGCGVCNASEMKGQIELKSGVLPPYLFLYSYAFRAQVDTVFVGAYGDFKIYLNSSSPTACILRLGQSSFNFFLNPVEKEITLTLVLSDGNILSGAVENSKEYTAFNDLSKLMDAYDGQLYNAIRLNQPDTSLYAFLSYYNKELTRYQQYYKGTYTADTLAEMRKIITDSGNMTALQSLKQNFFAGVNFADSSIADNPVYDNMIDFYIMALMDTSPVAQSKFLADLESKAQKSSKVFKATTFHLFNCFLAGKNEPALKAFIHWFNDSGTASTLPVLKAKVDKLEKALSGQPYIELKFNDANGAEKKLSDAVTKNKYTLLIIWESTCPHCQATIPLVKDLYSKYHAKGLAAFGVSLDEKETDWKNYLSVNHITWQNTWAGGSPNTVLDDYFLNSLPVLVLINQQGIIQKRFAGIEDLDGFLSQSLK